MEFIGRHREIEMMRNAIDSSRPELGIVYGRRRTGKSTLLKKFIGRKGDFYFEGLEKASGKKQIAHFTGQLATQSGTMPVLVRDWNDAFKAFSSHIARGKHYVVFDEFPWMASNRTELVALLKYYWDNVWKENPQLTLVLCGSIAGFMIKHLVHSKALHNRKTFEIHLGPLPAGEAKLFFKNYRSDFEILKFLMVFGGIPKYLEQIDPKKSFAENVDRLCFQKHGFFVNEYETLFKEQFKVTQNYGAIVKALASESLSKEHLAAKLKTIAGGGLTGYVKNLEMAEFVKVFQPYALRKAGTRTQRIYLWDEWLHFYFTFMQSRRDIIAHNEKPGLFESLSPSGLASYFGRAFERLCLKNVTPLLENLGTALHHIKGFGPFFRQGARGPGKKKPGVQIDMLIEKKGHILTLVECKYSPDPIGLTVIPDVKRKIDVLGAPRHYTLEKVLIAPGGVTADLADSGFFHHVLGSEALFYRY